MTLSLDSKSFTAAKVAAVEATNQKIELMLKTVPDFDDPTAKSWRDRAVGWVPGPFKQW